MILEIHPQSHEYIYDDLDTNAIIFHYDDGYFTIQAGVYLEEDDDLNEPFFELNDQGSSQCGGLARVVFSDSDIMLEFEDLHLFIGIYKYIKMILKQKIDREIVDFFVNYLFFGDNVFYKEGFDKNNKVDFVSKREYI